MSSLLPTGDSGLHSYDGRYDHNAEATFLELVSFKTLGITADHLVFVCQCLYDGVGPTSGSSRLSVSRTVQRRGVYAPLMESERIVVNSVVAAVQQLHCLCRVVPGSPSSFA